MRAFNFAVWAIKIHMLRVILRALWHCQPDHLPFLSVDMTPQLSGSSVDCPEAFVVSK